ncbi:uncharacterized protein LOC127861977 isoform X2 [Dreissena polymorpha]|uniref:uncharacterized protein LOC127861977 isoform X2 n=2 Tax=Dreissena polymorpha TaxID=45954 RepID=UPI0022645F7D|nr:uncharacterized protein LOC127861977 isoform X2 [Dreissena polymorpha]
MYDVNLNLVLVQIRSYDIKTQFCFTNHFGIQDWTITLEDTTFDHYDIFGLGMYASYDITIHSYTSSGNLTEYNVSCMTSEDVPNGSPDGLVCKGKTIKAVTCSWNNLTQVYWNGVPLGFRLQYAVMSDRSELKEVTLGADALSADVLSLTFATKYVFLLNAFTAKGQGTVYSTALGSTLGIENDTTAEPPTKYYCYEAVPGMIVFDWDEMPCTVYSGIIGGLFLLLLVFILILSCQACCQKGGATNIQLNIQLSKQTYLPSTHQWLLILTLVARATDTAPPSRGPKYPGWKEDDYNGNRHDNNTYSDSDQDTSSDDEYDDEDVEDIEADRDNVTKSSSLNNDCDTGKNLPRPTSKKAVIQRRERSGVSLASVLSSRQVQLEENEESADSDYDSQNESFDEGAYTNKHSEDIADANTLQGLYSVISNKKVRSQIKSKENKPPDDFGLKPMKIMSSHEKNISLNISLDESRSVSKSNISKTKMVTFIEGVNNIETINEISEGETMAPTNKSHEEKSCFKTVPKAKHVIFSSKNAKETDDIFVQEIEETNVNDLACVKAESSKDQNGIVAWKKTSVPTQTMNADRDEEVDTETFVAETESCPKMDKTNQVTPDTRPTSGEIWKKQVATLKQLDDNMDNSLHKKKSSIRTSEVTQSIKHSDWMDDNDYVPIPAVNKIHNAKQSTTNDHVYGNKPEYNFAPSNAWSQKKEEKTKRRKQTPVRQFSEPISLTHDHVLQAKRKLSEGDNHQAVNLYKINSEAILPEQAGIESIQLVDIESDDSHPLRGFPSNDTTTKLNHMAHNHLGTTMGKITGRNAHASQQPRVSSGRKSTKESNSYRRRSPIEAEPVFESNRLAKKFPFLADLTAKNKINHKETMNESFSKQANTTSIDRSMSYGFGVGKWRKVAVSWLNKSKIQNNATQTLNSEWT